MILLGPMSALIMLTYETSTYLKNSAFLPFKTSLNFYVMQSVFWMILVAAVSIAVYDRELAKEDPEREVLSLFPLYVAVISVLIRIYIMSLRAGFTSVGDWAALSDEPLTEKKLYNKLLKWAW